MSYIPFSNLLIANNISKAFIINSIVSDTSIQTDNIFLTEFLPLLKLPNYVRFQCNLYVALKYRLKVFCATTTVRQSLGTIRSITYFSYDVKIRKPVNLTCMSEY